MLQDVFFVIATDFKFNTQVAVKIEFGTANECFGVNILIYYYGVPDEQLVNEVR